MRILIATVTAGAGHLQAAAALEEAWRAFRPDDAVERVDVLDFTSQVFRKAYGGGYAQVVQHAPELWGFFFKHTDKPALLRKISRLRRSVSLLSAHKFAAHLKSFAPDVVLCPHFLPLEILGKLKSRSRGRRTPFCVCVVTDFEAHALWMEPAVDLYCVAAEETKARLVARGAPAANVVVTGIPIAAKFSALPSAAAARRSLGLRDDRPVLLVLSGGFGMGPVAGILAALERVERPIQVAVVCGRNPRLRRKLATQEHRHPTQVLGFVTNMQEWMAAADLILTKPGGLTSSEALACGRPLLILDPIPGQEAANSDFLLEHGAAVRINSLDDLAYRVEQLLGSRKLATMARAARALGRPAAARAVCEAVVRVLPSPPC